MIASDMLWVTSSTLIERFSTSPSRSTPADQGRVGHAGQHLGCLPALLVKPEDVKYAHPSKVDLGSQPPLIETEHAAGQPDPAAAAWDAEYAAGRYAGEEPVAFTSDILTVARRTGLPVASMSAAETVVTTCRWSLAALISPAWTSRPPPSPSSPPGLRTDGTS